MKVKFSGHARTQAELRFPTIDIDKELDDLVELGGQFGDGKAYLTKSDIVLIVSKDNTVITVMSKNMYMANVAARSRIHHAALLKPVEPLSKQAKDDIQRQVNLERIQLQREQRQKDQSQNTNGKSLKQREREQKEQAARADRLMRWRKEVLEIAKSDVEHDQDNGLHMMDTLKDRRQKMKELGYNSEVRSMYEALYLEYYMVRKVTKHPTTS